MELIPPVILYILVDFSIYLIVTLSLNLEVGYAGLPQFGRVLAVLTGALIAGAIPGRILALMYELPYGPEYAFYEYNYKVVNTLNTVLEKNPLLSIAIFVFTLILAMILGAIVGYLTSKPAIRLREAYLGITLLAMGDVLMLVTYYYTPIIGGTTGVSVIDPFRWTGVARFYIATFTLLGIALLVFLLIERLTKSPYGRVLRAMRDSELAITVYGRDIVKLRTYTLMVGAAIASLGGALYTFYTGSCIASTYTRVTWTFWPWAFMMLGGTGNNVGVMFGVLLFVIVKTLIVMYRGLLAPYVPFDPVWLEYTFVGMAIVLIAIFRPQGLIPEKPIFTISRKKIEELIKRLEVRTS